MRLSIPCLLLAASALADDSALFEKKVRPIFATQCAACHTQKTAMGGLDLSSAEAFARGGDNGALVDKQNPAASRLLRVLGYEEKIKMPPAGKLKDDQLAAIREWIEQGAKWPGGAAAQPAATARGMSITSEHRSFWSFQPVKQYEPPKVQQTAWVKSPVDAFILAKLEEKRVQPARPLSKAALLRRATFDLTGLPPTEEEIVAFVSDNSPDAFAKVVDRLLASPRYGERWGRHWLDVARYADSTGADEDHRYPHSWRYRDYVIDAFNRNLPYDRFILEQIAGDLLPSEEPGKPNTRGIVATGFLALGPKLIAEQDKPKMVYDTIDEQIDVTTRAFLGLTIACARCHDHKFDPITTKDYYALASIFASTKNYSRIETLVSQMYTAPLVPATEFAAWEAHQKKVTDAQEEVGRITDAELAAYAERLRPKVASYMTAAWRASQGAADAPADLDAEILKRWTAYLDPKEKRVFLERYYTATAETIGGIAASYEAEYTAGTKAWDEEMMRWRKKVENAKRAGMPPPEKPKVGVLNNPFFAEVALGKGGPFAIDEKEREKKFSAEAQTLLASLKAQIAALKKSAPPEPPMANAVCEGEPIVQHVFVRGDVNNKGDVVPKRFPEVIAGAGQKPVERGSGRKELAEWLASPAHPLTARVMVNRMWQWHFGEGLVRTTSNWGTTGERPSHPELLDYLAAKFIESGWSIKSMHRMLMLSSAYQMDSTASREARAADPDNRLLSRFPRRRLDVEEIRDAMLALDASLDLTMGGSLQSGQGTDGENSSERKSIDPSASLRRTVYLPLRRSNLPSLLNLFDFGDATTTGEGRARTNVAPQALFMMNSKFVEDRARGIAKRAGDDVDRLYRLVLNRAPAADELDAARDYATRMGVASLAKVLLASNEFIYVD